MSTQKKDSTFIPMPDLSGKKGFSKPQAPATAVNAPKTPANDSPPAGLPPTSDPAENPIQTALYKDFQTSPTVIKLPQPFLMENKLIQKVMIREITGAVEEEYNSPANKENFARYITCIMSACIVQLGDDFVKADYKTKEWRNFMLALPMSDREYLLYCIYALCKDNKEIVLSNIKCPSCKAEGFIASLDEMEVRYYDHTLQDFSFELRRGFVSGGITYKTVLAGIPDGATQEKVFPLYSTGGAKAETMLFAMCIKELKNVEANRKVGFNVDVARALSKIDRDTLNEKIGEKMPGLRGIVGMECDCGEKFFAPANVYDFFFR